MATSFPKIGLLVLLLVGSWHLCPAQTTQDLRTGATVAQAGEAVAASQPARVAVDLHALKPQLEAFQAILNRSLQQAFEMPFTLLQDAKGIYLPEFGVAFHMEVNLHPLRLISPFDPRPYTEEELRRARDSKLQRIQQLKARLKELLLEHGASLRALPAEQNVAVVVHLFNLPSEQSEELPSQLVIGAPRQAFAEYQARRLTREAFQMREFSLEF